MKTIGFSGYHKRVKVLPPDYVRSVPVCELCGEECSYDVQSVQLMCDVCWELHPDERKGQSPLYRIKVPRGPFNGRIRRMKKIPRVEYSWPKVEPEPRKRSRRGSTTTKQRSPMSHKNCTHARTASARKACREGRLK